MEPVNLLIDQLHGIARGAITLVPSLTVAIIVIFLAWLVNKLAAAALARTLRRTRLRKSLQELFTLLTSIAIWVIGIMIAAVILFPGLTPASILAGLGIGSVAIGFAFKDVFENFLAGIIILFRREMRIGDHVECEGVEGVVARIAIRESHIRQTDGQLVIVPNSILFKNPVTVRTDQEHRRVTVICGVAYDVDVDEARTVITDAVRGCDTVISDSKPIQIFAQEFASSSINFEVTWWTGSKPVEVRASRDQVVAAVKRALDDAGIEIPFPYRTLTFKEPLPLQRAPENKEQPADDD
ncbi:mechanosensitive ion channel protein MscS [Pelagivirga sediminicola]|uniref:Small-conductance mechanosensitive channel n=1 Tax=Pelagivirga sediminicola TaxID=2170575 RepID=A0A2T7G9Y5_9RHOB|nr:mechanosensitive ion channel family protein [Pelagivirga sediminicola]PVA11237.1 mechanosensitive ion channel protein MscS [Pelagivirga sediminicola]